RDKPRRRAAAGRDRAGRHPGAGRQPGRRGKAPEGSSRIIARTGRSHCPRRGSGRFWRSARSHCRGRTGRNRSAPCVQFSRHRWTSRQKQRLVTMSVTAARKAELIKTYGVKSGDTGSPEVQVALLSERINNLTEHFKPHVKDNLRRGGLLKLGPQRRQFLDFLRRPDAPP